MQATQLTFSSPSMTLLQHAQWTEISGEEYLRMLLGLSASQRHPAVVSCQYLFVDGHMSHAPSCKQAVPSNPLWRIHAGSESIRWKLWHAASRPQGRCPAHHGCEGHAACWSVSAATGSASSCLSHWSTPTLHFGLHVLWHFTSTLLLYNPSSLSRV